MDCHSLLFPANSTTSSIFSLPTVSLIPSMDFILCLPRALFPSIFPKEQSLSRPSPLKAFYSTHVRES
ncbi:hypothetical protein E2C01_087605 [Portunus trituberculatus]|uniref:Uncharacterized protein n=1 Tax=Portunus trituberculatus TaxID=210409 RepID=A0A5B7JDT8_PORTR|nr:hypothetical protein [Portunus trituberculatus]